MKDDYFPAETVTFAGKPKVEDFATANKENISNFAELILEENGNERLLYAEGTMLNVRIETGSVGQSGHSFLTNGTVFAATSLSKGDAVRIQYSGDLLLTYESQGQVVSYFLSGK